MTAFFSSPLDHRLVLIAVDESRLINILGHDLVLTQGLHVNSLGVQTRC